METRVLTAHVPVELAERIDERAKRIDRPRGWIVKQALAAWIDDEDERDRLTREAMADVRAGQFVQDADVQAWLDSLDTDSPLPMPQSK